MASQSTTAGGLALPRAPATTGSLLVPIPYLLVPTRAAATSPPLLAHPPTPLCPTPLSLPLPLQLSLSLALAPLPPWTMPQVGPAGASSGKFRRVPASSGRMGG